MASLVNVEWSSGIYDTKQFAVIFLRPADCPPETTARRRHVSALNGMVRLSAIEEIRISNRSVIRCVAGKTTMINNVL